MLPTQHGIFLLLFISLSIDAAPIFWEHEIATGLDSRDSSYREAGIDAAAFQKMPRDFFSSDHYRPLSPDTVSPWPYFLQGLFAAKDNADVASACFTHAIAAAGKDPGLAWVLAMEFDRCGMVGWEEKCLKKLELLFLTSGALSAPVIVQQLLYKSAYLNNRGNANDAEFFAAWAQRFDRRCLWPSVFALESNGIFNLPKTFAQARDLIGAVLASWENQIVFFRALFAWLFLVLQFVVAGILVGLGAKYLSPALHLSAERFSDVFSSKGKLLLALGAFGSVLFLGAIPFVWCFLFVVWRRFSAKDKHLAEVALVLFLLVPLGIKLNDMFDQALSANGSLMAYKKAVDEGYYSQLDSLIAARAQHGGGDYLAHTAAALYLCKKGSPLAAFPHIKVAQMLAHDDPAVIVAAGNVLYYSGDLVGARNAYQQCVQLYPQYEPAYFNLGQYYFNSMETAKGMEYITQATRLNPEYVDAFIKKNDECFSKDWPPLRQLICPDFAPAYFWKNVFPSYSGTWDTASKRFGGLFFGVPLIAYLILSGALLALLLILDASVWSKDLIKKVSSCKLCQAPVCRKCKRGSICRTCFDATEHIRNEQIRQRIMTKIQVRSRRSHAIAAILLNLVFPGVGTVYRGAPAYQSLPLLLATSMVYATLVSLVTATFEYPAWAVHGLFVPLYAVLFSYSAVFAVRAIVKSVAVLMKRSQ